MGRSFGGILGLTAFLTTIARGWMGRRGVESVLGNAALNLICFSAAGYVLGRLGAWMVEDSVRSRLSAEMAARKTEPPDAG